MFGTSPPAELIPLHGYCTDGNPRAAESRHLWQAGALGQADLSPRRLPLAGSPLLSASHLKTSRFALHFTPYSSARRAPTAHHGEDTAPRAPRGLRALPTPEGTRRQEAAHGGTPARCEGAGPGPAGHTSAPRPPPFPRTPGRARTRAFARTPQGPAEVRATAGSPARDPAAPGRAGVGRSARHSPLAPSPPIPAAATQAPPRALGAGGRAAAPARAASPSPDLARPRPRPPWRQGTSISPPPVSEGRRREADPSSHPRPKPPRGELALPPRPARPAQPGPAPPPGSGGGGGSETGELPRRRDYSSQRPPRGRGGGGAWGTPTPSEHRAATRPPDLAPPRRRLRPAVERARGARGGLLRPR